MKTKPDRLSLVDAWRGANRSSQILVLALAMTMVGAWQTRAADEAAAQRLLAEARAKETHAQQLRAAAATTMQKAADDQMEASAEERDSRILTAQALKLAGADANKQKAFTLRIEARKFTSESHNHLVSARNAEQ